MKLLKNALIVPVLAAGLTTSIIHAQVDGNWISTASGNQLWETAANWSSNPNIPGGADSTVRIESNITANTNVNISNTTRTVGRLFIGDADGTSSFTISGNVPLVFDRTGGAEIHMDQGGSNTISTNITLDSNLTIYNNLSASTNLLLSGTISGTGGITKEGSGQLELNKTSTFTGGFTWNEGNLRLVQAHLGTGVWNINANDATLTVVGITTTNSGMTNINLNANITVDVSETTNSRLLPNASTGITLTGNRVITVLSDLSAPTTSYFQIRGVSDNGDGYSLTKAGSGRMQYANNVNIGGPLIINGGTMEAMASNLLPAGIAVTVNNGATWELKANAQTIATLDLVDGSITGSGSALVATTYNLSSGTISKPITGTGSVVNKDTAGTVTISAVASHTGATTVNGGTLLISGAGTINSTSGITVNNGGIFSYSSSTGLTRNITLNSGGTFLHSGSVNYSTGTFTWTDGTLAGTNWNGNLNNLVVGANRTISPGNSPGTANTGSQTWAGGGSYLLEINNATGTMGADPGWDLVSGTGTLTISATSTDKFTIYVTSLNLANEAGDAVNFNAGMNYQWLIADFANPVSGFSQDKFAIDISNFTNSILPGSSFAVVLGNDPSVTGGDNTQIYLTYTIPEPSSWMLLLVGFGALLLRKQRQKPAVNSFR